MTQSDPSESHHSGKVFARNTLTSLLAQGAPAIIGILVVPFLIRRLGLDRFAMISVSWMLIGYLSLFDLGLGRVLTKIVAEKLSVNDSRGAALSTWMVLRFMFFFSLLITGLAILATPLIIKHLLIIPPKLQQESLVAFYVLCLGIPFVTLSSALRGVLDAYHDFSSANLTQSLSGFGNFLLPAACALFSQSLVPVIVSLVFVRIFSFAMFLFQVVRLMGRPHFAKRNFWGEVWEVTGLGGWITIANTITPIIASLDRGMLSAFLPIGNLAYYTTPYDVGARLWIVPTAITRVLLPTFSSLQKNYEDKVVLTFDRGLRTIFLTLALPVFIFVVFAPELLKIWLGTDFAVHSAPVTRWLFIGILINSVSWVPFVFLLAVGMASYATKLLMVTALPYFTALYFAIGAFGAEGAAFVWMFSFFINMFLLFARSQQKVNKLKFVLWKRALEICLFCAIALILSAQPEPMIRGSCSVIFLFLFLFYAWLRLLLHTEKEYAKKLFHQFTSSKKI